MTNHTIPVNRQASKVFWRAPWWAKLWESPTKPKQVIPTLEWELHADLFSAPPVATGGEVKDRRGIRIRFFNGGVKAVITGYAFRDCKNPAFRNNTKHWWCLCEDGEVLQLRWTSQVKGRRYEVLNADGSVSENQKP